MPRDLEHFELTRLDGEAPRRKRPGFGQTPLRDPAQHGQRLLDEVDAIASEHHSRARPTGISAQLVFRLRHAAPIEDDLTAIGLNVLAVEPDKTIVAFASEAHLAEFRRRLTEYRKAGAGRYEYKRLGYITALEPLKPEDRMGRQLAAEPLAEGELARLDIEFMHPGSRDQCQAYVQDVKHFLLLGGGRLTDSYIGSSLCIARCHVTAGLLEQLLQVDYVLQVDRVPTAAFETALLWSTTVQDLGIIPSPPPDAPGVLVVDSGVMGGHPVLRPALGEAADFVGGPGSGDGSDVNGHGTGVAGIAVYGDVRECIAKRRFAPKVALFSARVLDGNGEYDPDKLLETQLREAVLHFVQAYPQCRVVNLSLGDRERYYRPNEKQFRLAALVDELAYELRDRNTLFVISVGNYDVGPVSEETVSRYPRYLLDEPGARIVDPATAALAVTVGALATGGAPVRFEDDVRRGVAGQAGYPSPFTRSGPGVDGMVKPDLVHLGGDLTFDPRMGSGDDPGLGVPTTCARFAPPGGRLFDSRNGTSFAAPAVAHIAARVFGQFPGASANLVRALLATSARVPSGRPGALGGNGTGERTMRLYGYGQPDLDRAVFSDQSEVLLLAEDDMAVDSFRLYQLPPLPSAFLEARGERWIGVALAFDPPTRHTRGDSYIGVSMDFRVARGTPIEQVRDVLRKRTAAGGPQTEDELESRWSKLPGRQKLGLSPGPRARNAGTLQKGVWCSARPSAWACAGGPLILAVSCLRKWAPAEIDRQRYAVVVALGHSNEGVRLHDHVRQHARLAQRVRVRV